ncbi:MAG: DNA-3-methyladenine glycosylase family protein [Acidobacteriota bacterium]
MKITISTPSNFNFRRTVMSHGWYALPPFEFADDKWRLARVIDLGSAKPVTVTISEAKRGMLVNSSRQAGQRAAEKIVRDVRHMFRLDDDMSLFYEAVSQQPEFTWIATQGAGRLLRSPTVFEDLVKMICTTNCSWALTEKMVKSLVNELGRESNDGRKSFPTPEVMAQQSEKFYRDKIRSGYRAPYLKELAERVASGELKVETWLPREQRGSSPTVREGSISHDDFMKQIKQVKGVGNYAAENLLKLLGRYDGLALDSWTRAQFAKLRNQGRKASDKKIARFYARFNSWRGLALWCDMTRLWLEPDRVGE